MKKICLLILIIFPTLIFAQATVPQGGTGLNSVAPYGLLVGDSALRLKATTSPTVGYITATSTSATSTLQQTSITGAINLLGEYFINFTNYVRSLFSASSPLTYSGGVVGCTTADGSHAGCLTSTDWNTFNAKQAAGSYVLQATTLTANSPLTGGGDLSTNRSFGCTTADGSHAGCLTSTDWNTFNNKANAGSFSSGSPQFGIQFNGGSGTFVATSTFLFSTTSTINYLSLNDPHATNLYWGGSDTILLYSTAEATNHAYTSDLQMQTYDGVGSYSSNFLVGVHQLGFDFEYSGYDGYQKMALGEVFNSNYFDFSRPFGFGTTTPWGALSASTTSSTNPALVVEQLGIAPSAIFLGGNIGIGTTSPYSTLSVNARAGLSSFAIGSTSSTYFEIDKFGHQNSQGVASTLSSCGGSPSVVSGNDTAGIFKVGTGTVTACTVTFKGAYKQKSKFGPICNVNMATTTGITLSASTTATTLLISSSATMATQFVQYQCVGVF